MKLKTLLFELNNFNDNEEVEIFIEGYEVLGYAIERNFDIIKRKHRINLRFDYKDNL